MGSNRKGEEPEPPEVVPAVLVVDADVLETVTHLCILRPRVVTQLAQGGVGEGLGGKPSQRL